MRTVIVDYESGNLHSAEKAFQRMALEHDAGQVIVSDKAEIVAAADRIVVPGDGAFPACMAALKGRGGLFEALQEAVLVQGRPFLGICVGMQLMASRGHEYQLTDGLGWIPGDVKKISPDDPTLKVPHMGWNDLVVHQAHPVLAGVETGDHAYFVHSYQVQPEDDAHVLAHVEYGGRVTAIIGRDTMIGAQFHPEKSQQTGLRIIANFLTWRP